MSIGQEKHRFVALDPLAAVAGALNERNAPNTLKKVRQAMDAMSPDLACAPVWQPIETAPKDGREVILAVKMRAGIQHGVVVGHYMEGGHCIEDHPPIAAGWYFWNGCQFDKASVPTHWMAMPHHPEWKPGGWQTQKQERGV
jgi:hypothetical protein